jgi:fructokinase
MEKQHTIIGIGDILWDEFPDSRQLGGAPANVAIHAGSLGGKGVVISRIGDDQDGNDIKKLLDEKNISHYLAVDPDHPTGRVSVELDQDGTAAYTIHEEVAWDYLAWDETMARIISGADAICFGSLAQRNPVSRKTIQDAVRATRPDCIRLFDINLRQHYYSEEIIVQMLELASVLKLNHEELDRISHMILKADTETDRLAELISRFGLDMVVLTRGKDGSRLFMDHIRDSVYPAESGPIVDTVGAGDAFSAVVVSGLLKGLELDRIHRTASKTAAFVCSQKGATPQLPDHLIRPVSM